MRLQSRSLVPVLFSACQDAMRTAYSFIIAPARWRLALFSRIACHGMSCLSPFVVLSTAALVIKVADSSVVPYMSAVQRVLAAGLDDLLARCELVGTGAGRRKLEVEEAGEFASSVRFLGTLRVVERKLLGVFRGVYRSDHG